MPLTEPDETVNVRDLARAAGQVVDRVRLQSRHVMIKRYQTPAAVIVPIEWWQRATAVLAAEPGARP